MSILTTVSGSYPKVGDTAEEQKLRRALHQLDKNEISEEDFVRIQQETTKEVIQEQINAGLDIVSDGRIQWDDALTYEAKKMTGFTLTGLIRYFDTNTFYREPIVESRVEYRYPIISDDYKFAAGASSKPVKAILTGPYTLAKLSKNKFYREFRQLVFDIAYIIHREAVSLEEAGCTVIQFDEPAILSNKDDWKIFYQAQEIVMAQLSKAEKILFLNFGNLDGIYPKVCSLNIDTLGCELTKNHDNWRILRTSPLEKKLMAGIIDARNTKMETPEEIAALIQQLGEIVPPGKLFLSPSHSLEFLPRDCARKKLAALASVAHQTNEAKVS